MKFGEVLLDEAGGAILAHGVALAERRLRKGRVLGDADIEALRQAGMDRVVVARLEPGDVGEDEAAGRIADLARGGNLEATAPFTGRVNLFAGAHGLAVYHRALLDRLNRIDESITIAALAPWHVVEPRQMVATVKIIPFAVAGEALEALLEAIREAGGLFSVAPFAPHRVGLIQTLLPGTRDKVLDKTADVLRRRVEALDGTLAGDRHCAHRASDVAAAIADWLDQGCDMVMISGASAITDRRDVVPAAIEQAGGRIEHFGMPVDPGNLLLVGRHGEVPLIGLPGCVRSPKMNGFDWVFQRLAAGQPVDGEAIMGMGAGGLLTEISSRPLPRVAACAPAPLPRAQRIAAVILAAGQSRRMGAINKLLAEIGGQPMVATVADAVLGSRARPVVAVVGHQADRLRAALAGRDMVFVENPDYAQGLSTSLKRGLMALPDDVDGALICLGDMPRVAPAQIDRLIAAFDPVEGRAICVPTVHGKRGNPVLFARRFFEEMEAVGGDVGARHLIGEAPELVCEVEMSDDGVLLDIDTPEALTEARE